MHPLKFLDSWSDISSALPGSYDPLLVTLSVGELNQVFMTVLRNAEAIEEKGTINIKTATSDNSVTVEISDTGKASRRINWQHCSTLISPPETPTSV